MKKTLSIILAILMIVTTVPMAFAADIVAGGNCGAEGDNLTWMLDSDGLLTISGEGAMEDYNTESPWYSYLDKIKSVVIEDGVTSIGSFAFYNCTSLASVTIPDSITSIRSLAFYNCTSLASVTIPDSVITIAAGAFSCCESLQSITIPDSVTSIGGYGTFEGCRSLESITIGNGVTHIGNLVFSNCTSLKSVTIPDSVTSIDDSAFYNCTSLESVTIPDSVASIGYQAFYCCESLQAVYFGGTEKKWDEITSGNNDESLNNATIFFKDGARCKKHTDEDHDGYCDICKEMTPERAYCTCNCHKSGFMGFIWKIVQFFSKLFKINPVCECGAAHY